ncbi:tetratricopeptide repeat protein [Methylococcus sp. EFPC2]|uniref:tetratricopeptide repeat protein n=1 Tax=Methylococcus sp. EFPC2 TaxID=2812648 RepID=UPI001968213D|nr:tetratricopeptide repeat protein [Methylococcus sp. EFPC2]QSA97042.1 sel1 repeat family protein [Methylococcus sp. EFPC2]
MKSLIFSFLLLVFSVQALADLEAGVDAVARRDYATALKEFKLLAQEGDVAAQVNLGNLIMKGLGVKQNYVEAERWYRNAAEQNERMAQSKLGILYYHGLGVLKDTAEAARWFEKAARQGEPSAQAILATMYAQGEGVKPDLAQAYYWYTLAMEQGSEEARRGRDSLAEEMTPGQTDEALKRLAETRRDLERKEDAQVDGTAAAASQPAASLAEEKTAQPESATPLRSAHKHKAAKSGKKKHKPAARKRRRKHH